jgi:hypothetical protein
MSDMRPEGDRMSKERNAFPRPISRADGPPIVDYGSNGMTLREWYAGMALAGLIRQLKYGANEPADFATKCFEIADEMMKAAEVRRK